MAESQYSVFQSEFPRLLKLKSSLMFGGWMRRMDKLQMLLAFNPQPWTCSGLLDLSAVLTPPTVFDLLTWFLQHYTLVISEVGTRRETDLSIPAGSDPTPGGVNRRGRKWRLMRSVKKLRSEDSTTISQGLFM